MDITEVSLLHHVCIVLLALWGLSKFDCCHPVAYFISLVYLYLVHDGYIMRLRKKMEFEERKKSNQRRVLTDSETVRWLNHAVEKIWPICMENIASQKFLYPIIPWFLEKYKPWTAKQAMVQHLYLGRNPPIFTEMRVLRQGTGDDHLILELGMNFLTGEDMSAILAVQLRKRLGGMWTKLHITGMHVEGKVLIGVKFIPGWPFLSRLRVCFAEPPYFQMTVKPLSTHGIDVTELPGIAGWLDKLLSIAFEQTLVEPNMLVVDVTKFAEPEKGDWFSVDVKDPVAHVRVEIIEAADMKPSDLNGLADPYVKGQVGPYRFRTKIQKKTLSPKWLEEFRIPIVTWEADNELKLEVCDKDHIFDDYLGKYSININELQVGERQDMWVALQNVKLGRLHIALTVEQNGNANPNPHQNQVAEEENPKLGESSSFKSVDKQGAFPSNRTSFSSRGSFSSRASDRSPRVADKLDPIDIDGQKETGIWACEPGSEISQTWEPRKGKSRRADTEILGEQTDSKRDENPEGRSSKFRDGLRKFGSMFHRSPKEEHLGMIDESEAGVPSPYMNVREVGSTNIGVNYVVEGDGIMSPEGGSGSQLSPRNGKVRDKAKNFFKHVLSRKDSTKGDSMKGSSTTSESDSNDEDLVPPSLRHNVPRTGDTIPIASQPISTNEYGDGDSSKLMEKRVSTDSADDRVELGNLKNSSSFRASCGAESGKDIAELKHAVPSTVAPEENTPKD